MTYWNGYRYTDPIAQALTKEHGTEVDLYNTGGGCICLRGQLEGGIYILVGSGFDGPLLYEEERADVPFGGGYGVGVYNENAAWDGRTLAYACDDRATTGEEVVGLARRALGMAAAQTADSTHYVEWHRDCAGKIVIRNWPQ